MQLDGPVTIEPQRDAALRSHQYYVVSYDKDGNETMGFRFIVDDDGEMWYVGEPFRLTKHVAMIT